jgi:hypothetical protein
MVLPTPTSSASRTPFEIGRRRAKAAASIWWGFSPCTDVELAGDAVLVDHGARPYHLLSNNDVPTQEILAFCKRTYAANWEERFATDLADVLADMGQKPAAAVKLVLRDPSTGQLTTLPRAPMTADNRRAVKRALDARPQTPDQMRRALDARPQTPDQMRRALDAFQAALEERWSYLSPSRFDHRGSIAGIRQRVDAGLTRPEFRREFQKVIGRGIDGHAAVAGWDRDLPAGHLPFLVEPVGDRFVAFLPDRSALLAEELPYVESIDGGALATWLDAAAPYIPNGSPPYVRQHALRYLRAIQFLRKELGLQQSSTVDVTLASADAARRRTLRLKVSTSVPSYGVWPPADYKPALPAGIAYLRLTEMADDDAGAPAKILRHHAAADALIIDVRDNGGGLRGALRHVAGSFSSPTTNPASSMPPSTASTPTTAHGAWKNATSIPRIGPAGPLSNAPRSRSSGNPSAPSTPRPRARTATGTTCSSAPRPAPGPSSIPSSSS